MASNEIQFMSAALMADEGRYLADKHPDVCLMLFHRIPQSGPDHTWFRSQDLTQREAALDGAIIDNGSTAPTNVSATEEAALAELAPLWTRVKNDGFDLAVVGQAPRSLAEQQYLCLALSALMQNITKLPVLRSGPLMRRIMIGALQDSAVSSAGAGIAQRL
jgi:hypothetical protein